MVETPINEGSSTLHAKEPTWVPVEATSDFSIHNLPLGVFSTKADLRPRVGMAIGKSVVDLAALSEAGLIGPAAFPRGESPAMTIEHFRAPSLNSLIGMGRPALLALKTQVRFLLSASNTALRAHPSVEGLVLPARDARMLMPVEVGDYVDFYSSLQHAANVGAMFRDPEKPLLPNWKHIPIGYHGRASSLIPSGVDFHRPVGQLKLKESEPPIFAPTRELDFELEVAAIVGKGTSLGHRVSIDEAEDHIFGVVLLNDLSARDVQRWEYVPLGPFLAKSFATAVSPWVVTMDALEPFRTVGPVQDVPVLPYLNAHKPGHFDVELQVALKTKKMFEPHRICKTNFTNLYWSMAQQLAHLTSNGSRVRVGDMLASGTISGKETDAYGSLLELSWKGTRPLTLPDGSTRTFLEDGDTLVMSGFAERNGCRVGFGPLENTVLPSI